jgi:hypothetical protein
MFFQPEGTLRIDGYYLIDTITENEAAIQHWDLCLFDGHVFTI